MSGILNEQLWWIIGYAVLFYVIVFRFHTITPEYDRLLGVGYIMFGAGLSLKYVPQSLFVYAGGSIVIAWLLFFYRIDINRPKLRITIFNIALIATLLLMHLFGR
jgi:hypothetical protein